MSSYNGVSKKKETMKTTLTIVCMMSAAFAVAAIQKLSAKKTSISESELRALANTAPDVKNGGTLYSVAMATTNNVELQQEYLKASAACLIACGKNDVYKKHVKGKLLNAAEFEDELKDDCQQCSGAGAKERRCYECSGNGQCSRCKGSGQTVHVGFDRQNTVKSCGKCNGNGSCRKCGGEGTLKEKCVTCAGTGKAFSKTVAAHVFRDSCNAIADNMKFAKETDVAKEDVPHKNEGKELSKSNDGKMKREDNADVGKAEKTSFSASELEALANADPDAKTGVRLYSAAMAATNDVNRQQGYFKLAAACFIACGKIDIYKRRIKGKLLNATEFEGELKENCKQCGLGAGVKQNRCNDCNGNGRCSRCKTGGGFGSSRRGSGDLIRNATCSKCNNNGNCPKCGGDGYMKGKCVTCEGTGKVLSKTAAARVFRDSCNKIADRMKSPSDKAEELFAKRCKAGGDFASVEYMGINYAVIENTQGDENFVVVSGKHNPNDYASSFMIFPTLDSRNQWYAAIVECTEKLKNWIHVSAKNKVKYVRKEIPTYAYACGNGITHGRGVADLLRKALREPCAQLDTDLVKFIGEVKASDDTFNRHRIAIQMGCGDSFCRVVFVAGGTIEEIDDQIIKFLTFVNPESLANAREKQAKAEALFQ